MKSIRTFIVVILALNLLTACSWFNAESNSAADAGDAGVDAATAGYNDSTPGITGTEIQSIDLAAASQVENPVANMGPEFSNPNNPLSHLTIYFMYDSADIQQDFIPVLAAHAQYLVAHPGQRLTLEGHADERGSREYNIALGEKRSKAVARFLKEQNVSDMQITEVSYGEEKPAAEGHDEVSWRLNRRVEINYQGR